MTTEPESTSGRGETGGDLSVTALYTSQVWRWGRLPGAALFDTPEARAVYRVTNGALWLARLLIWRLGSLKHGLLHRHVMIDTLLRRSGSHQVLELAAGLSRRGATFSADPDVDYVEVDLPHVVEAKRRLLARTPEGTAVARRPNLRMAGADVTDTALWSLVDPRPGLFVVAEGLLMYLDAGAQRALWRMVADLLRSAGGGTLAFDLLPSPEEPRPGPVGAVLGWLMRRFTGGRSFVRDERTRDDLVRELREAGFDEVHLYEPRAVAEDWSLPHPRVRSRILVFECRITP
ncbi:MAG: class I SAM-dependent methyltransferase [Myxococcota bacterium]